MGRPLKTGSLKYITVLDPACSILAYLMYIQFQFPTPQLLFRSASGSHVQVENLVVSFKDPQLSQASVYL
ncbi:hypothetical protein DSO57_1039469, partial [Entomophthora muscae]